MVKNRKVLFWCIANLFLILLSFYMSRAVILLPTAILAVLIVRSKAIGEGFAYYCFFLPFAVLFKLSPGSTTMNVVLLIALLYRMLSKGVQGHSKRLLLSFAVLAAYCVLITVLHGLPNLLALVKLLVSLFFIYEIALNYSDDLLCTGGHYYIVGLLCSLAVAAFKKSIPNMEGYIYTAENMNESTGETIDRFMGLWYDPNGYAVFVLVALALAYILYLKHFYNLPVFCVFAGILAVAGAMSVSKMFLLVLAAYVVLLILYHFSHRISRGILLLFLVALVGFVVYRLFPDIIDNYLYRMTAADDLDGFTTGRSDIWKVYIDTMRRNLSYLFGNGIGCSLPLVYEAGGYVARAAHNTPIQMVYHIGIFGVLLFLYFLREAMRCCSIRAGGCVRRNLVTYSVAFVFIVCIMALDTFTKELFPVFVIFSMLSVYAFPKNRSETDVCTRKAEGGGVQT